jgi:hypothetical protein
MKYITTNHDEYKPISPCPEMARDAADTFSPSTTEGEAFDSPLKAIRKHCIDCCGETALEVRLCPATGCNLYPFRFGKDSLRKKTQLSEEEKARRREILKKNRGAKVQ